MDADTSGHSDNSICSDDTEYLLGQNVSIREIDDDDDDIQTHESARAPPSISRSYHSSPQHSPQKLQQINSANLRSPQRKVVNVKPGKGPSGSQRSPGHSTARQVEKTYSSKGTAKGDRKSQTQQNYATGDVLRGQSQKLQSNYGTETTRYDQDVDRVPKSKKQVSDSYMYTKHPDGPSKFQSQESNKAIHTYQKVIGSPKMKTELPYDTSQLTPPTRDKVNSKRKHIEPGRSPVRESVPPVNQNNWEIDSEISVDMVNGGRNSMEIESNDLESEMSEATEDLIGREVDHQEDEDFTAKLKELNLAVNFDVGTNGEQYSVNVIILVTVRFAKLLTHGFQNSFEIPEALKCFMPLKQEVLSGLMGRLQLILTLLAKWIFTP